MWYKNMGTPFFPFVINHAFDGQTDGRTDGRTDSILMAIPGLYYMQSDDNKKP